VRRGERRSVRQRWCPPSRPSPLCRRRLHVPPSITLLRGPVFSGSGAEESNPAFAPLTADFSVGDLPAAGCGLFARGCDGYYHRVLGSRIPVLLYKRSGPAPDSGPRAGRLASGSIELPELDVTNSLALRLPMATLGGFLEERSLLPLGRAALAPTVLASGSFARPSCLG
jgi:hypothetical protein